MKSFDLEVIASLLGGALFGDAGVKVSRVAALWEAAPGDISYIDNLFHKDALRDTQASCVLLPDSMRAMCPTNALVVSDPLAAISECSAVLKKSTVRTGGIDSTAVISASARLGQNVVIAPHVVIGDAVCIGDNCSIGSGSVIERGVSLGQDVTLASNVVISSACQIGHRVFLDNACVIGAKPFHLYKQAGSWREGPNVGHVVIEDDVSIGANSVISRGSLSATSIGRGVKIDNLVQIGHDVIIGAHSCVAGCAAIGAHTQVGQHCVIGGASSVAGFLMIADEAVITGMSSVTKSLNRMGVYSSGTTVTKHDLWRKNVGRFHRLDNYVKRLKRLEKYCDLEKET